MTDAYTYIAKPTGTPYSNINVEGRQQYDEPGILYDDTSVYYDGVDAFAYTNVAKPTGENTVIIKVGMATGLIISPTYSTEHDISISQYTKIPKPTI